MVKLKEIVEFMQTRFPLDYAEEYDNPGLLVGRADKDVKKVLLCLDCDESVVAEAAREGAELIISHHPVIFGGINSVTDADPVGKMLLCAIENNISVYCAHTNLDNCPQGLTDYLCNKLDLTPIEPIDKNAGRICAAKPNLRLLELCAKIKDRLDLETVSTTAQMNRVVSRVAVCNGSGGSLAQCARNKGADVFITGDVKYHQARDFYLWDNFEYICISHYDSEKIATELLFDVLKEHFEKRLEAVISKENTDILTVV